MTPSFPIASAIGGPKANCRGSSEKTGIMEQPHVRRVAQPGNVYPSTHGPVREMEEIDAVRPVSG